MKHYLQSPRRRRVPPPLMTTPLFSLAVVFLVTFLAAACGSGGSGANSGTTGTDAVSAGLATTLPTPEATIDLNRPTAGAVEHLTSVSAGDRFVISKFGVDAPLTYRKVEPDGVMPNPDGPDDIAYYDFSAWTGMGGAPGRGGNAVFAGHVDSGKKACKNGTVNPPCEAVLWDLNRLKLGDELEVRLSGQTFRYRVTSNQAVSAADGPWNQIVASTAEESMTVITCGGDFNRETGEYTYRQVVTAVRM